MVIEDKKRNYNSIFLYSFFCFVFIAEVIRFAKPYYNVKQNLLTTETETTLLANAILTEEESSVDYVANSVSPCHYMKSSSSGLNNKKSQHEKKLKGVIALWRERPPTSYCVKFESFATLLSLVKDEYYESRPFTSGGYNWTFLIYPNGNKKDSATGYVSLYARIDNSSLISNPKDVYAEFKFFVYNRVQDKYYTYQETEAKRFHLFKPEWGAPLFQPTSVFKVPSAGYIFDGEQCVFGIDVFVAQTFKEWEVFSFKQNIKDPIYTWKLIKFSTLFSESYTSESFSSGGSNWVLKVYPSGDGYGKGNSLSLYLLSEANEKAYVRAKLRVLDQIQSNHVQKLVDGWPNATFNNNGWGFEKFVPLVDLQNASKGLLVGDAIKVEVEFIAFSKTDSTPNDFY